MFESRDVVLLLPENSCYTDGKILELKHPKNSQSCLVYLDEGSSNIYELFKLKENHVSWFVDNNVAGNTKLTISIPLDPLFMIIPYIMENCSRFCPLDQILIDEKYPSIMELEQLISKEQLSHIGDVKSLDKIVRFDKNKTMDWLFKKVDNVVQQSKDSNISPGISSTLTDEEYKRYASGIVSDYISPSLSSDLHDMLGLPVIDYETEKPPKKKKFNPIINADSAKGMKQNKGKEKAPKIPKAQSSNTKGMKSMSSFFKVIEK